MYELRSRVEALRKKQKDIEKELEQLSRIRSLEPLQKNQKDFEKELSLLERKSIRRREIFSALRTQDRTTIAPFRNVYVDVNGNDDTGDGSFYNPFASIEKGVTVANQISVANVFVAIGAGTYTVNNPFNLPNNTFLVGWGDAVWVAQPSNLTADVFQINDANAEVQFQDGAIIGLGTTGSGINQTGVNSTVLCFGITMRDIGGSGFKTSNGSFFCESTELSELDSIGIGYDVSNGATMLVASNRVLDNATVTTAFNVDGSGSLLDLNGPTIIQSTNVTRALNVDNGGRVAILNAAFNDVNTGIKIDNGSTVVGVAFSFLRTSVDIEVVDAASTLGAVGAAINKNKIQFPVGFKNENMLFVDDTEDEEATKIYGDLFVGRPERGTLLTTGQGEPYTRGMIVLTTDSTATSTTDGGNFIDVTTAATSPTGSTFSFQGTAANHTILLASTLSDGSSLLKHPGVFIIQTTAAVEVTKRSFLFEYWDGAMWQTITVMSIEDVNSFRYGNEVFIRANTREHIRYNQDVINPWTAKTINGTNAFWSRIRIDTTVTTAPVFQQFRIIANYGEFAQDGYSRFYGLARFRQTLLASGNIFSETGGIANFNLDVGTGGLPTGWTHRGNNQQFNGNGDAIYTQFIMPRGIDTSTPLNIIMYYIPEQAGAVTTDATFIISVLPIESQGVLEADPTGGTTPVARTLTNTEVRTANPGQATTISTPSTNNEKIQRIQSDPVDISNYYEGDIVFLRIELDEDGTPNKDFFVLSVEVSAVLWTSGERLA